MNIVSKENPPTTEIRTAHDASDDARLQLNPSNGDAKLDIELDESFPTSDPPSTTQPGRGIDLAPPSSHGDDVEKAKI